MTKRFGEFTDFVVSTLAATSAADISDPIVAVNTGCVLVNLVFTGTVTNTSVNVSVGLIDDNGVIGWSAPLAAAVRTLPDTSVVADFLVFDTFRAKSIVIALEDAIAGGGTVDVMYSFAVPTL